MPVRNFSQTVSSSLANGEQKAQKEKNIYLTTRELNQDYKSSTASEKTESTPCLVMQKKGAKVPDNCTTYTYYAQNESESVLANETNFTNILTIRWEG